MMESLQSFFDKHVNITSNFTTNISDQVNYILFITLSISVIIVLVICNICICCFIRQQKRRRELIDYPSNTLQYIRFPRNIRKPYRTSSNNSSNKVMLSSPELPRHHV